MSTTQSEDRRKVKKSKTSTRERILKSALRFIRGKSYNSFSLDDIAEEIGIRKQSILYYFPTKEALGVSSVEYFSKHLITAMEKLEIMELNSWDKLDHYFNYFSKDLTKNLVCPAGVLSSEIQSIPLEMQIQLNKLFSYYIEWLSNLLLKGRTSKEFNFTGDANSVALFIASTMEGAMLFARAHNKISDFNLITTELKKLLR